MTKTNKIYVLLDPVTGEAKYVGKTRQKYICDRMVKHREAARGYTRAVGCTPWIKELLDKGLEAKTMILEEAENWVEAERFWISYLRFLGADLMNLSDGGDGQKGHVPSLATRKKLRGPSGRKMSPGHKAILLAISKGKALSDETKEKIRKARAKQAPITIEARSKISAALKGKPKPPRTAEHSAAISRAKTGRRGRKWAHERKLQHSLRMKGRPVSEEWKQKMREGWERRRGRLAAKKD